MRDHAITLACLRLGYPAHYAKGAHLLPDDLTASLETAGIGPASGAAPLSRNERPVSVA